MSSFECQETAFGWPMSGLGPGVGTVAAAKRANPKRTSEMQPQWRRPALSTAESHGEHHLFTELNSLSTGSLLYIYIILSMIIPVLQVRILRLKDIKEFA